MTPLITERLEHITRLTLNRPQKANALDTALVDAMLAAVEQAAGDRTRLLVLAGAGPHFCAGFDFSEVEAASEGDLLLRFVRIEQLLQALWHAPFATLAMTHGGAFGAGADLVCACEQRIAAPGSRFRMPGLRFGLALGTRRLAARIGPRYARLLLGASAVFDADEALRMRFIDGIVPHTQWPDHLQDAGAAATALDAGARAALNRLTAPDTRDADLAELVRSAADPGLKARIRAFRAGDA